MLSAARILIMSQDTAYVEAIKSGLSIYPQTVAVVHVKTQWDAELKLMPGQTTVIVADAETVAIDGSRHMQMLERFSNVRVILTAYKETNVQNLLGGGIQDFVPKSIIFNSFNINRLINMIMTRLGVPASDIVTDNNDASTSDVPGETQRVIAIAASTGGMEALMQIIPQFPVTIPPIVLVLHIAAGFTKMIAARFDSECKISVKEAQAGDRLMPGQMLIAPAGKHMRLFDHHVRLSVDCFVGEKINNAIPSADVLFESVANISRIKAVGVILTGMGADGAKGLKAMRKNGARTIGQDKETCTIYGMSKVAMNMGAVEYQLPLNKIASMISSLCIGGAL